MSRRDCAGGGAFRNGCVQTDDAIGFAAAQRDDVVTPERVDEIARADVTTTINLERPLPVDIDSLMAVANAARSTSVADLRAYAGDDVAGVEGLASA